MSEGNLGYMPSELLPCFVIKSLHFMRLRGMREPIEGVATSRAGMHSRRPDSLHLPYPQGQAVSTCESACVPPAAINSTRLIITAQGKALGAGFQCWWCFLVPSWPTAILCSVQGGGTWGNNTVFAPNDGLQRFLRSVANAWEFLLLLSFSTLLLCCKSKFKTARGTEKIFFFCSFGGIWLVV